MSSRPFNRSKAGDILTDAGTQVDRGYIAVVAYSATEAVVGDTDALLNDGACSGTAATTLTPTGTLPCARNIVITADGTADDIKAVQAVVHGTNIAGETISETMPAFTVNTKGAVTGSKAFATVTSVVVPAMDGAGVTLDIGFGSVLGLPFELSRNTLLYTFFNNVKESTPATIATSASAVESNTITLASTLDGSAIKAYFVV